MVTSDQLIGTWKVIEDPFYRSEETFYSFTPTVVTIAFETKKRIQKIFCTYELDGNFNITDQPSHPKIERSKIKVEGDILTLDYNGQITRLKRSPEPRGGTLKTMEWLKSLIAKQPTYRLVILGIALLAITHFSPRYVGVIPGLAGMMTWFIVLGRAVGTSIDEKRPSTLRP